MRKYIIFLFAFIFPMIVMSQIKKVAILQPVDREGNISYAHKLMLRASLSKAITNTEGYEAYDRTDIDAIMGEQNFQRTGMVSDDQIRQLGEMTGAMYILVAEAAKVDENNMFITAKILNVESAKTEMTDNVLMANSPSDIQHGCESLANKLLGIRTSATQKNIRSPNNNSQISSKNSSRQASLPANSNYSIGSLIQFEDGSKGIVYYLTEKGGLAVSLTERISPWGIGKGNKDVANIPNERSPNKYYMKGYAERCTSDLIQIMGSYSNSAAAFCVQYGRKWHLPSAAELELLFNSPDIDIIVESIQKHGGSALSSYYWLCNENSKDKAFCINTNGIISAQFKDINQKVRAVREF